MNEVRSRHFPGVKAGGGMSTSVEADTTPTRAGALAPVAVSPKEGQMDTPRGALAGVLGTEGVFFVGPIQQVRRVGLVVALALSLALLLVLHSAISRAAHGCSNNLSASEEEGISKLHCAAVYFPAVLVLLVAALLAAWVALQPSKAWVAWYGVSGVAGKYRVFEALYILGLSAAFFVTGSSLVMLNKHILQGLQFGYPLTLSGLGLLASAVTIHTAVVLGFASMREESRVVVAGSAWYRVALPMGASKALTLAAGNAVYMYLGMGFIQMLKAFTPVWVLLLMGTYGLAQPSRSALCGLCLIIAGTLVEVKGNLDWTVVGLLLMGMSGLAEAASLVIAQKLMQKAKFTVVESLYTLAPPGCICLLTFAAFWEWPKLIRAGDQRKFLEHPAYFAASAVMGLIVNFSNLALVQATSSLTLKILNTARSVGLVVVGALLYGEKATLLELGGYSVSLLGVVGYNLAQAFPAAAESWEGELLRLFGAPPSAGDAHMPGGGGVSQEGDAAGAGEATEMIAPPSMGEGKEEP